MTVSLIQIRAVIGIFNCRVSVKSNQVNNLAKKLISMFEMLLFCSHFIESAFIYLLIFLYLFTFLSCHGDIELNPGPRKEKKNSLSVCHWNLNSLSAHNFSKLTQLKAYNAIYKHDFICLSETFLDSSIPDNLLEIEGYRLVRSDHSNDIKRGGVCIYYKESLPVRVINIPFIKEALLLEMNYNNKKVFISVIYRSPSQTTDEFDSFLLNFEQILNEARRKYRRTKRALEKSKKSWASKDEDCIL